MCTVHKDYLGWEAQDGHLDFHTAPELWAGSNVSVYWSSLLKSNIWKSQKQGHMYCHFVPGCLWHHEQGCHVWQNCVLHHEPTLLSCVAELCITSRANPFVMCGRIVYYITSQPFCHVWQNCVLHHEPTLLSCVAELCITSRANPFIMCGRIVYYITSQPFFCFSSVKSEPTWLHPERLKLEPPKSTPTT